MECPYCNSLDLLYDFERSYIVCRNCGTVVDTIFVEQFIGISNGYEWEYSKPSVKEAINLKKNAGYISRLKHYSREVKAYEKYWNRARSTSIRVDINALKTVLSGGKARIYRHVFDSNLEEMIEKDPLIRKILEILDEDAILSSRTLRSKVALALLIKNVLLYGEADIDEIAKQTSVSKVHMHRLVTTLKNRMKYLKPKLQNLKQLATPNPIAIA